MLAAVPFAKCKHAFLTGFWPDLLANKGRLHDWRIETTEGLPVSKMVGLEADHEGVLLICRDPAAIRHFLKDAFDKYTKPAKLSGPFWYYMNEWLGEGLFTAQHGVGAPDAGKSWMRQRKIASAIFSRANFNKAFQLAFAAKAERLCEVLASPAEHNERVDMQKHFFSFTMDSIMKIFFGEEADTIGGLENKYGAAYDLAHKNMVDLVISKALHFKLICLLPWPLGGPGGLLWRLVAASCEEHRRFREACAVLDAESSRLVRACRSDPKLPERTDLLALFVRSEDTHFSEKFLRDVVLNFIIAGRDTTACTLTWMFYLLATHPEIQEELCREIDAKAPEEPSFKAYSASEMPYLNGVLYETLRLYPPVPFDGKMAMEDDVLPDGTPVPQGTEMLFLPYAMGRDGKVWKEPLKVDPHRWIPFVDPPPHEFPVFQAGPRLCLGKDMATFEAKLLASRLLRDYTFELAPGEAEKITYNNTLTMSLCNSPKQDSHCLWLLPKKRRAA